MGADMTHTHDGQPCHRDEAATTSSAASEASSGCDGHGSCGGDQGCGGHATLIPELDARTIHHRIRQSAIFGVLVGLAPGDGATIVAPHDPGPLVELMEQRLPGEYDVEVTCQNSDEWRVTFHRRGA